MRIPFPYRLPGVLLAALFSVPYSVAVNLDDLNGDWRMINEGGRPIELIEDGTYVTPTVSGKYSLLKQGRLKLETQLLGTLSIQIFDHITLNEGILVMADKNGAKAVWIRETDSTRKFMFQDSEYFSALEGHWRGQSVSDDGKKDESESITKIASDQYERSVCTTTSTSAGASGEQTIEYTTYPTINARTFVLSGRLPGNRMAIMKITLNARMHARVENIRLEGTADVRLEMESQLVNGEQTGVFTMQLPTGETIRGTSVNRRIAGSGLKQAALEPPQARPEPVAKPGLSPSGPSTDAMATLAKGVDQQWAQLANVLDRRMGLLTNIFKIVSSSANVGRSALTAVASAATTSQKIRIGPDSTPIAQAELDVFSNAQAQLRTALSGLMAAANKASDLEANPTFQMLDAQLQGTENRITVEAGRYNDAVRKYNAAIEGIGGNAPLGRFSVRPIFKLDPSVTGANTPATFDFGPTAPGTH